MVQQIREELKNLAEEDYKQFNERLLPGVKNVIGVRLPVLRKIAKKVARDHGIQYLDEAYALFGEDSYHEEFLVWGLVIAYMKAAKEERKKRLDEFVPKISNWAVCDSLSPKVFGKHKTELLQKIRLWILSGHTYTCRFGTGMLMRWFLDEDFRPEYLKMPAAVRSEKYYVNMMTAWFFATALAKQWDAAIPYLEQNRLDVWTHNKTIQKARESYRITPEQKEYLKTLKRK